MKLLANIGLVVTAFAWGSQIPVLNDLFGRWDPYFLAAVRYVLAVPVLLLILAVIEPSRSMLRPLLEWRVWALGTALGIFVPLYTLGVAHANPNTAAILGSTGPVVAIFVARAGFGMKMERAMAPSIVLAMAGGVLATYDPARAGSPFDIRGGEFLILLSSVCWNWYSLAAQRWLAHWSQVRISCITMVPGGLISLLIYLGAVASGAASPLTTAPTQALDLGLIVWMTVGAVIIGLFGWNYGVRHLGLVVASLFLNFVPVFAILITTILGTPPTIMQLLGGALVLAGVMASQLRHLPWRRRPAPLPDSATN